MTTVEDIISHVMEEMRVVVDGCVQNMRRVKAGGITPESVRDLLVLSHGQMSPLYQLANIRNIDVNSLEIKPWEKSLLQEIEKAFIKSDLGLTPQNNGEVIRIVSPPLTEERRRQLVKKVKGDIEAVKVRIRNIRQEAKEKIKALKKDKISQDVLENAENSLQKVTNKNIQELDVLFNKKETELLTL